MGEERIELTLDFGLQSSSSSFSHSHCHCSHCGCCNSEGPQLVITSFSNGDGSDGSETKFHDLLGPSVKKQRFDPQKTVHPMFTDDPEDGTDTNENPNSNRDAAERALAARDYLEKGGLLAEQGMLKEAISQWILGLSANPPQYEASRLWESRAQAHMALEEWFLAVRCAEYATQNDPAWGDGFVTLGRAQLNLGEPSMAVASFQRALTIGLESEADTEEAKQDLCYAKEQAAKAKAMRDALPPEKRDHVLVREGQKIE